MNTGRTSRWFEDLLRSPCATGWPRYVSFSMFYFFFLVAPLIVEGFISTFCAQLQQKQVRAALKIEKPIKQKDCALAVVHFNQKYNNHKRSKNTL